MDLSAQDYVALLELYSRSTRLIGSGDAEGWADLFTADGVFAMPAIEAFGAPPLEVRGRKALVGYIRQVIEGTFDAQIGLAPGTKKRHQVTNVLLEGDGPAAAKGSAYLLMSVLESGHPPRLFGMGVYTDRFVKTPDGWKIAHRLLTPDA
ncbi:MAG: nuclear transport factor 2 family protein [Thermoanaerobaculia bacterium]|nr:nuclear transport factor 2 family protein [Thermoanaerobaculia bacterium]